MTDAIDDLEMDSVIDCVTTLPLEDDSWDKLVGEDEIPVLLLLIGDV